MNNVHFKVSRSKGLVNTKRSFMKILSLPVEKLLARLNN